MHRQLVIVLGLIERDRKYLMTRRIDPDHSQWHHRWEIPGGKINRNETPLEALHREVYEETRLKICSQVLLGVHTHHWQTTAGEQQTFMLVYHCKVNSGEVILSPDENDAFFWGSIEEILSFPNLLDGTIELFGSFSHQLANNTKAHHSSLKAEQHQIFF